MNFMIAALMCSPPISRGALHARKAEQDFFFEKKKQKTFDPFGFGFCGQSERRFAKKQSFLHPIAADCFGFGASG
jgi:hypothetical protein